MTYMPAPPFGYRYENSQLVRDDDEFTIVKLILSKRKTKPKPTSYGVIAAELNREGILNRGKYWNPTTLWYIVQREK